MQRRAVADSRRLALLVCAYAALAAHLASAHSASRLALSGERHIRSARHLHSADSSAPAANASAVPQIHSRKCGVAEVTAQEAQQVVGAIASNFEMRQQVRRSSRAHPRACAASCAVRKLTEKLYLQGRAAPVTVNVFFHIVQVRLPSESARRAQTGAGCVRASLA